MSVMLLGNISSGYFRNSETITPKLLENLEESVHSEQVTVWYMSSKSHFKISKIGIYL